MSTRTATTPPSAPQQEPTSQRRGSRIALAVIIGLSVLGLVGVVLFFALRNRSGGSSGGGNGPNPPPPPPPVPPTQACVGVSMNLQGARINGTSAPPASPPAPFAGMAACADACNGTRAWNYTISLGGCTCVTDFPTSGDLATFIPPVYSGFYPNQPSTVGAPCGTFAATGQRMNSTQEVAASTQDSDAACAAFCTGKSVGWTRQSSTGRCYCVPNGLWTFNKAPISASRGWSAGVLPPAV